MKNQLPSTTQKSNQEGSRAERSIDRASLTFLAGAAAFGAALTTGLIEQSLATELVPDDLQSGAFIAGTAAMIGATTILTSKRNH